MSLKRISGLALAGLGLSAILIPATAGIFARDKSAETTAHPRERFYAVFLSHQSPDNKIRNAHTFAGFYRTTGVGPQQRVVESAVISWFPKSEIVDLGRRAEIGVNHQIADSIAWAEARDLDVTIDGVYEITPNLFNRAVKQADRLNRGELRYQAFDRYSRKTAKNCIHAVADIVEEPWLMGSGPTRGRDATLLVIRHLRSHFVSDNLASESLPLLAELKLERYAQPTAELASSR